MKKTSKTLPVKRIIETKRSKLNLTQAIVDQMLSLGVPVDRMLSEVADNLEPATTAPVGTATDSKGDISAKELAALKLKQTKTGITEYWKNFKPTEENIHIESINPADGTGVATIADGSGNSFVMFFSLHSFEPPAVSCSSLKKVDYSKATIDQGL